jgi:hypothetical protein
MKKYIVGVKEVHIVSIEVEANSKEEALEKAEGMIEEVQNSQPEYSHTADPDEWTVVEY